VASSCGTRPINERVARKSLTIRGHRPHAPAVRLTIPQMMLISVVLPAPFGPSRAEDLPRRMSRLTLLSARNPDA